VKRHVTEKKIPGNFF
jgi:hypothetical protein